MNEEFWLTRYAREGNPLHAWRAYEESREEGRPVPDLVLQYLDRVARRLFAVSTIHGQVSALRKSRSTKIELWRRTAIREHAESMISKMRQKYGLPATHDPAALVLHALEMDRRGRGHIFERYRTSAHLEHIAWWVAEEIVMGSKPYLAIETVAKDLRVARTTVQRAWKAHPDMLTRVRRDRKAHGLGP